MKKVFATLITLTLIFSMVMTTCAMPPIKVVVGGEKLETDVEPIIVNGRTMLPVRAVFESIGADVDYISEERKVVAIKDDTTVTFVIASNVMTINGVEKEIDVPAMIKDSRTLVPLRACAEAFDLDVTWNGDTRTARVKIPVSVPVETWYKNSENEKFYYFYDENGNNTLLSNADGSVYEKFVYDENNNEVFLEFSSGGWNKKTYDKYGNLVYAQGASGSWTEYRYDEDGNMIYKKDSDGVLYTYEYDEKRNIIKEHYWDVNEESESICYTYYYFYHYDEKDRLIRKDESYTYRCEDAHYTVEYTYDNKGNLILEEFSNGGWTKYTYNENNKLIRKTLCYNGGFEITDEYEYNSDGKLIFHDHNDGYTKYTYGNDGFLIYSETDQRYTKYKVIIK